MNEQMRHEREIIIGIGDFSSCPGWPLFISFIISLKNYTMCFVFRFDYDDIFSLPYFYDLRRFVPFFFVVVFLNFVDIPDASQCFLLRCTFDFIFQLFISLLFYCQ